MIRAVIFDFNGVIAAEDCPVGKPDPAIYRLTCERLNALASSVKPITPAQCLVIEDSRAGMRVLAVATTYPLDMLDQADHVLLNLRNVSPHDLIGAMDHVGRPS